MSKLLKHMLFMALASIIIVPFGATAAAEHLQTHTSYKESHTQKLFKEQSIYKQKYLLALVEKYAPETKKEWQTELERSVALRKEVKQLQGESASDKHNSWKSENHEKKMKHMKEQKNKYKEFKEAVKSEDEEKIKAALGKLLKDFKHKNKIMEKKIAKLKK